VSDARSPTRSPSSWCGTRWPRSKYLYPAVREHVPGGDATADKELSDHAEVEHLLKELEKADADTGDFAALTGQLIRTVNAREGRGARLVPGTAGHAGPADLHRLGEQVQVAKTVAPTRPHSSAPDRPPLNLLLAPGAGLVDRIRDHLSGRGQ
jgi:hypothetical protein